MISATELEQQTRSAIADFLHRLRPGGLIVLTSVIPDGKTDTQTFTDLAQAEVWALAANKTANVYYSVNPTIGPVARKATKEQIAALAFLHVDVDCRAGEDFHQERGRILDLLTINRPAGVPAPTVIVNSGGGYQALWRLAEPIPINGDVAQAEEAERWNRALEQVFSADNCHNCDRILRLPGTTNWPNKKKRDKGRTPTDAVVYQWPEGADAYPLAAFSVKLPPLKGASGTAGASRRAPSSATLAVGTPKPAATPVDVEALRTWAETNGKTIAERTLALIATGDDPLAPGKYADRSRAVFHVACELHRAEVPYELIAGVLLGPNAIAAHVLGQPQPAIYAQRQVERARGSVESSWKEITQDGRPQKSYRNTVTALRRMGLQCSHDVFRGRNFVEGHEVQQFVGEFSDQAEALLRLAVHQHFGFDPGKEHVRDAVAELCALYRFDSLADHLNGLPGWDGQPRLDRWLIDYLGAKDAPYEREAGATWLLAAVVRAFEPGTKFDHMLVLVGAQGVGKSTALRTVAGGDAFFTDANFLGARDTREVLEATAGAWIVECAELAGMRRKETEALKHEITKQEDKGRPAYARSPLTMRRRFVLAGTTNSPKFLHDETGNRRFWPVEVGTAKLAELRADRDQLVAEAIARYRAGGWMLYLQGDAAGGARIAQERRRAVEDGIAAVLESLDPSRADHSYRGQAAVPAGAVFNLLGIPAERRRGQLAADVRRAMEHLGWIAHPDPVRVVGRSEKCRAYTWGGESKPKGDKAPQAF